MGDFLGLQRRQLAFLPVFRVPGRLKLDGGAHRQADERMRDSRLQPATGSKEA